MGRVRRALLILSLLLVAAPAAQAEVRVIDTTSGARSIPVTEPETTVAGWSDDGAALLLSRHDRLSWFDLATGAMTALPQNLQDAKSRGPGGGWVELDYREPASVVHAPDGRELARLPLVTFWNGPEVGWSRDGSRVALSGMGFFVVLDTASGANLLERDRSYDFTEQAFAPDGSAVLVSDEQRVIRFELSSGRPTTVYRSERDTYPAAAWGPDGRVALTLASGVGVPGLPTIRVSTSDPALWSGDGTTLHYLTPTAELCSFGGNGLRVGAPGLPPRDVFAGEDVTVGTAHWSPVGAKLAADVGSNAVEEERGKRRPWPKRIARDYHMIAPGGDAALRRIVVRAAHSLRNSAGREATLLRVRQDFYRLPKRYSKAGDTIVREALADQIDRWLVAAGFEPIEAFDEITC